MSKSTLVYCATDKEIFDLLMSSKQKITESIMIELSKDRGIFYSPSDSRETLARNLSLLPHDYYDLNVMLDRREHPGRAEKITSIILNSPLTIDDIKDVSKEYTEQAPPDEKIISNQEGTNKYNVKIEYSEIDFSKTRLIQRRHKEADIEFIIEGDKTIVRMPANDRAKGIADKLKNQLEGRKNIVIPADLIELTEFNHLKRTEFFTSLISKMPGFKLENVTSVSVESSIKDVEEHGLDLEDNQENEEAKQKMLALVKNVALKGQSLLASEEYNQLKGKGFYITSIIWQSSKTIHPFPLVEFEAGFEDSENLAGFKYSVRGVRNYQKGEYTKTLRKASSEEKQEFLSLIEHTAHLILAELRQKAEEGAVTDPTNGGNP
jgi:hypothetical protein